MKLINGRGQLGEALKKLNIQSDATIYHTWQHLDKSEAVQKECYEKFVEYRKAHPNERIVLVSTHSTKNNPYVSYKHKAEELADGVVRLPIIIGKGACEKFKNKDSEAYDYMDLITVEDAAETVAWYTKTNRTDIYTEKGFTIPAKLVKYLIQFGNAI